MVPDPIAPVAIAGDECDNNIGAGMDGTCGEVTIEDLTKILDES